MRKFTRVVRRKVGMLPDHSIHFVGPYLYLISSRGNWVETCTKNSFIRRIYKKSSIVEFDIISLPCTAEEINELCRYGKITKLYSLSLARLIERKSPIMLDTTLLHVYNVKLGNFYFQLHNLTKIIKRTKKDICKAQTIIETEPAIRFEVGELIEEL